MADHLLPDNPTRAVTINGKAYEMEVGNVTLALDIADWQESVEAVGDAPGTDAFRELARRGTAIVATALGDAAAEELMGGRNRLNLLRLVRLLGILADEMAGAEAMEALAEAARGFADTGDDD